MFYEFLTFTFEKNHLLIKSNGTSCRFRGRLTDVGDDGDGGGNRMCGHLPFDSYHAPFFSPEWVLPVPLNRTPLLGKHWEMWQVAGPVERSVIVNI